MAFEPQATSTLPGVEPDVLLLILEAAFDSPAREGDQQQGLTAISSGALLKKYFTSLSSSALRATIRWLSRRGSLLLVGRMSIACLTSHTMGPFSPSFTRYRTHV